MRQFNESPELIDISRPLGNGTACWPGDVPYSFRLGWTKAAGASVNVGAIETSVHTATHCDAPFHFDDAGDTIDQLPLDLFAGPAVVVDVRGAARWRERLLGCDLKKTPRVLFHTGAWPDSSRFPESIPVMEADLPDWLGSRGACLVGVDLPLVDLLESKTLDNHHALGRQGIVIVEGLWLEAARPGVYELLALPLRLSGADGAPLRAALRCLP